MLIWRFFQYSLSYHSIESVFLDPDFFNLKVGPIKMILDLSAKYGNFLLVLLDNRLKLCNQNPL